MGLFTNIGNRVRVEGAGLNYAQEKDVFRNAGYEKLPGTKTIQDPFNNRERLSINLQDLDKGRGGVHQFLKREYGMGDETALNIVVAGRNEPQNLPRPENAKHFRNVGQQQVAPGSASTQIKIKSPTQAEQVDAGIRSSFGTNDKARYGDKDYRNAIALQDVHMVAQRMEEPDFFDAIDLMNNNPGIRESPAMVNMRHDNDYVQQMARAHEALNYERIGPKPEGYIAEGMFGQVKELAPGYVEKTTPPVVEWPPRGVDSDEAGYLYDARDFKREAEIQDKLSRTHIAPKVEAFNILDNGSTELITRDLRDNFDFGESRYTQLEDTISGNSTPQQKAQAMAAKGILDVKRKQQEAIAISNGLKLDDRHEGNVVVNKLTGNPLQIDFGMVRNVEGPAKDFQRADTVVAGFRNAGLTDEADIFDGLIREAMDANDSAMLKDLAQQGASRLMKIKKMPKNYKTVSELAPVARDPRMAGVYF